MDKQKPINPVNWATGLAIFARSEQSKKIYVQLKPKKAGE